MSHLRTFVANQVLSRIRAFLGVFCPDFYSDIEDFTQILCRYLSKISAAGTSGLGFYELLEGVAQVEYAAHMTHFKSPEKINLAHNITPPLPHDSPGKSSRARFVKESAPCFPLESVRTVQFSFHM